MSNCPHPRRPVTVDEVRLAVRCRRGTVIVIDDDGEILRALASLIEMEGYACRTFASANEYFAAVTTGVPRFPGSVCVLSDVKMPEVDGLELQQRLAEAGDLPLVLMSGNSGAAEVVAAFHGGAVDFLLKPIEDDLLFAAIEKALARHRERQQSTTRASDMADRMARLTTREREIIRLASQGFINRDIGARLGIALRTVKLHRQRAMEKLGIDGIVDLIRLYPDDLPVTDRTP
jgi:FixJ family two-component response regulator